MAESRVEVRLFETNYKCDTCGKGNMQYQRICKGESPNYLFEHKCDHVDCGAVQDFPHTYPRHDTVLRRKKHV